MKGGSTKLVRDIVREYAGNLGSQEAAEEEEAGTGSGLRGGSSSFLLWQYLLK